MDNPIVLDSKLHVPMEHLPFGCLSEFSVTVKDSDGEDYVIDFYEQDIENAVCHFSAGKQDLIKKFFGKKIVDNRTVKKAKNKLTFKGALRDHQKGPAQQIIDNEMGWGQLDAHPRFGKTVVMAWLTCYWGQKTLFISHQDDLSNQALKTFYNLTDVIDKEYESGSQIIGIIDDFDDIYKYDVCFITYQKFISDKGMKMLDKFKEEFGVVFVDEVHKAAADRYSMVVNSFASSKKIGVTGTIERKDGLHIINEFVFGPVIAVGHSEQLPCTVYPVETMVSVPINANNIKIFHTKSQNFLALHEGRNNLIFDTMEQWANSGFFGVGLTVRTDHCDLIAKELNKRGIRAEAYHSKKFGTNKKAREACLERCRSGETQMLVAYRTMMLGIDIPKWDVMFNIMPTANKPAYYQELCRVRTPVPGKKRGYIIDFIDNHPVLRNYYAARKKVYEKHEIEIASW